MTMSTDEKLTEVLERLAARASTPPDGQARVQQRLRWRRNRRRAVLAAAAVTVVATVTSAAFSDPFPSDETDTATVASEGDAPSAPTPTPVPSPSPTPPAETGLPRLSLVVPGLSLTSAHIERTEFTDAQLAQSLGYTHLQSFRPARDDWRPPSVYLYTTYAGAPFGIGDESPDDVTTIVDVAGNRGYLLVDGPQRSLGWRLADGTTAYLFAPNVPAEQLLTVARSMTPRPGGHGWDVGALPDGLVPVLDEPNRHRPISESHSLTFQGPGGQVELHSYRGSAVDFEARVAGYSVGADVTTATVDGRPAAVTTGSDDVRILWYDDPEEVVNYLIVDRALGVDIETLAAGVRRLSEQQWQAVLEDADTTYWSGDQPSTSTSTSTP